MERNLARIRALINNLGCTPAELAAIVLLLATATVALGVLWWNAQPRPASPGPAAAAEQPSGSAQPSELALREGPVVVHVSGAVASPGVVELPAGARAHEALAAAGGALPEAVIDQLNLARVVQDGEQVYVPDASEAAATADGPGAADPTGRVNINRADASELETLPGIGPVLAERIVAHREANGPFVTLDDLREVSGIGDKKFAALADLITV